MTLAFLAAYVRLHKVILCSYYLLIYQLLDFSHAMLGISPINFSTQADVVLPCHLKTLTFGADFDQSLANVILPEGLNSLIFGAEFNQSLVGTEWLSCKPGACFSRPRLVDGRVLLCFFCFFFTVSCGVAWGGARTCMLRCIMYGLLRHARLGVEQRHSCYAVYVRAASSRMGWGWGGVGKNVHVTYVRAATSRMGWGGVGP